jgi:sec-independent protein translocase protein TatC
MALRLRRPKGESTGSMTIVEHLSELRTRLMISLAAVAGGAAVAWPLYGPVFKFLTNPFCTFVTHHPQFALDPQHPCKLVFLSVLEPFLIKLKVVVLLGLFIALPIVLYQFWRFITPGLTDKERKYVVPFVFASVVLFAFGAWFALLTLPKAMSFLLGFAGTSRIGLTLSIAKYVGFVILLILAFGLSFEFPVVLVSLTLAGVLSSRKLRDWRRYSILFIAIFAAVITPSQDWFTMTAMMVPMLVFYEFSIIIARLLKK